MARPNLPPETQAEIEKAKEKLFSTRREMELLLLRTDVIQRDVRSLSPAQRKPAQLKLALRRYASSMFDCEAQFYAKHARDEAQLRAWLEGLAAYVEAKVVRHTTLQSGGIYYPSDYDLHCSAGERRAAIADELRQCVEHWTKAFRSPSKELDIPTPELQPGAASEPSKRQHYAPESRESRLQLFVADRKTSIATVCRSARVFKTNMQQWRRGELADTSAMSERIEDVLSGKAPLV